MGIKDGNKTGLNCERGGLTLEAAVIFPVFIAFMLLLINFINLAMAYVAMDHAVGESVKQIAALSYPLKYLKCEDPNGVSENLVGILTGPFGGSGGGAAETADAAVGGLVAVFGNVLKEKAYEELEGMIREYCLNSIKDSNIPGIVRPGDIEITGMKLYNPNSPENSMETINGRTLDNRDIALVVEYRVKLPVPFLPVRDIRLSSTAVERAWVDMEEQTRG
ncbi:MAG: TadE/TadG family type IV pilus assembly protein [Bacillota bacterium]